MWAGIHGRIRGRVPPANSTPQSVEKGDKVRHACVALRGLPRGEDTLDQGEEEGGKENHVCCEQFKIAPSGVFSGGICFKTDSSGTARGEQDVLEILGKKHSKIQCQLPSGPPTEASGSG